MFDWNASVWSTVAGAMDLLVAPAFARPGYAARARNFRPLPARDASPPFVVTGANAGIGKAIATALAKQGGEVVMVCRSPERATEARRDIIDVSGANETQISVVIADLADLESARRACDEITKRWPALSAVIHNAGALVDERITTPQGVELTYSVHVAAPHLMTTLLTPLLRKSGHGRVVFLASGGLYGQRLDVGSLREGPGKFDGVRAYANAKRAQLVLTRRWAERLAPDVVVTAMHPGWVDTSGVQSALPKFYRLTKPFLRSPAEGADTAVWLATAPARHLNGGSFYLDRVPRTEHLVGFGTSAKPGDEEAAWALVEEEIAPFL